jgi:hypothetical protein
VDGLAAVGPGAGQDLVEDDPEREEVAAGVDLGGRRQLFGRGVPELSDEFVRAGQLFLGLRDLG